MAMVTISVSEAAMASAITWFELNFPVPRNRREPNSLPAITNFSIVFVCIFGFRFIDTAEEYGGWAVLG